MCDGLVVACRKQKEIGVDAAARDESAGGGRGMPSCRNLRATRVRHERLFRVRVWSRHTSGRGSRYISQTLRVPFRRSATFTEMGST